MDKMKRWMSVEDVAREANLDESKVRKCDTSRLGDLRVGGRVNWPVRQIHQKTDEAKANHLGK